MVTGRNLVQAQIRVAEGYKLSDPEIGITSQEDIELRGFAIQCRVTTEDPANNFAPDFGTIKAYRTRRRLRRAPRRRPAAMPAPRSPRITIRCWSRSPPGG